MNSEKIVNDIFDELPLFARIHRAAVLKTYVKANHLPLLGVALSIILWVI